MGCEALVLPSRAVAASDAFKRQVGRVAKNVHDSMSVRTCMYVNIYADNHSHSPDSCRR